MRRAGRWLRRAIVGLLALLLLAGTTVAALVWWTLPAARHEARLPALAAPVEITLDAHGIPRIIAASEADAAMALGWLHARDRMFQMETMRRGVSGRLAELGGPVALRLDRMVRTLGLARRADVDEAALNPETRAVLEAYAAGVNAWIDANGRRAAPEFLPLGGPEPWRPRDSLLWGRLMGLWLSGSWQADAARHALADRLPPDRLDELWPTDASPGRPDRPLASAAAPPWLRDAAPHWSRDAAPHWSRDAAPHWSRDAAPPWSRDAIPTWPEPGTLPASASNAWAVGGALSASGAPMLASDPHLGFQAPILWYLVRIELPGGRFLAGATSPGVPFVVIGRNERLAWGFTTTHSDTQDVFLERLVDADHYETPDGPRPFTRIEERIAVRGAEPVVLRVRETRHGPVLSDLDDAPSIPGTIVRAVAMANLVAPDTAAAGLHALNRATSLPAARAAAAQITSPPQNLMVAAADGGIALYLTGRVPVRAGGDGTRPTNGWQGAGDWTGFVPFDALPHVENPASAVLVNANNRVAPPAHPIFLGRDWFGDWRFRRIGALLAERPTHDLASFGAIQRDRRSLLAVELLLAPGAPLGRMARPEGVAGRALDRLRGWDGEIAPDRPEPLIWNAWLVAFDRAVMAQAGIAPGEWSGGARLLRFVLNAPDRGAWWCGGDCLALAATTLGTAVATLAATHGPDLDAWRWGAVHVARFEHPLLRFVPVLRDMIRLRAPTGGDEVTVDRGGLDRQFGHVHGAGLRLVADLGSVDGIAAVIATGQSGHPLSTHWGDQLPRWRDGALIPLTRAPERVTGRIALRP